MLEIDIKRGQNDMVSDLSQLVQTIPTDLSSVNSTTAYIWNRTQKLSEQKVETQLEIDACKCRPIRLNWRGIDFYTRTDTNIHAQRSNKVKTDKYYKL